jgi:hypothetical protein
MAGARPIGLFVGKPVVGLSNTRAPALAAAGVTAVLPRAPSPALHAPNSNESAIRP